MRDSIFMQCTDSGPTFMQWVFGDIGAAEFHGTISINDSAHATEIGTSGAPIVFSVEGLPLNSTKQGQWTQLFSSAARPVSSRNDMYEVRVDVTSMEGIKLSCTMHGGKAENAHAIWIDPRLTFSPRRLITVIAEAKLPVTVYSMPDGSKVHHTGLMEKKGDDLLGRWSSRIFVLDGHRLRWFKDCDAYERNTAHLGELHANDIIAIHQTKNKLTHFSVEIAGREYRLRCQTAQVTKTLLYCRTSTRA
jgi:hypothetical protein